MSIFCLLGFHKFPKYEWSSFERALATYLGVDLAVKKCGGIKIIDVPIAVIHYPGITCLRCGKYIAYSSRGFFE